MSACAIHRRRHDSAIPRSFAISRIGFSRRRANSTARRRNSGGFGAGIRTPLRRPSSPHIWWSGKAGELHLLYQATSTVTAHRTDPKRQAVQWIWTGPADARSLHDLAQLDAAAAGGRTVA